MTTLSIILPDPLAKASQETAKKMGISRTQFIRLAIAHELENFQAELEQKAMVQSIVAMKKSARYLKESEDIIDEFHHNLPDEGKEWWKK